MKKPTSTHISIDENHLKILDLFHKGFYQVYRHMEPSKRLQLLDFAPMLFHKWYQSALVPETILFPSNIISSDKELELLEGEVVSYNLKVDKTQRPARQFQYERQIYTVERHPIIRDIKAVLLHCQPDVVMDDNGQLTQNDREAILPKLSQHDELYLEYLIMLCWQMHFLVQLPSIYSTRMQSANYLDFLALPAQVQLSQLANASIALAVSQMQDAMHLDWDFVSADFFMPYLESSQDVDKMFVDIYQMLDINIEEIWKKASQSELTSDEASIMSSFYYMGILLDKWLITPMSFYFHAIEPLYFTPFQFINVINNLTSLLIMEGDMAMELYSPCSFYRQTPIGKALFGETDDVQTLHLIPAFIPFDQLVQAVYHEQKIQKTLAKQENTEREPIYTFKIRYTSFKRKWKVVELYSYIDLESFCDEICAAFGLEEVLDYTLTTWDHNQFPMEFSPETSKRAVNKAHTRTLGSLQMEIGDRLVFTPIPDKNKQLELTLLKISARNPYIIYPRIKQQSALLTKAEKMEDLF